MIEPLVERVLKSLPKSDSYTVALSGGVDSVVLLHTLNQIRNLQNIKLKAIHINHGISSNALMWQNFCQELCTKLAIPLSIIQGKITKNGGESLENNARNFRYQAFSNESNTIITLAHHQNDQIETMLSQIFRGSDLHNIASMKTISQKQQTIFWRPLLNVTKLQILDYAKQFNLNFVDDESNLDKKYLRNFIRHEIMPSLNSWDNHIETKLLNVLKITLNKL